MYKFVLDDDQHLLKLTPLEKLIYKTVSMKAAEGAEINEIKKACNGIKRNDITKALESLVRATKLKKLKSLKSKNRNIYFISEIEPSDAVIDNLQENFEF